MAKEAKEDKAKEPKAAKQGKGDKSAKGSDAKGKGEKEPKAKEPKSTVVPRLKTRYEQEILPALGEHLGRPNRLSLPRVEKIVVSMGVGSAIADKKHMEDAVSAMSEITGQKPLVCKARKSVANFRLREGLAIGCKVTLRGARMYEFLDRLISLALPRVRDFRGLNPDAFDGHGNYSLGLTEQLVFPELNPDKYTRPQGMNITLCISGNSNNDSLELLKGFGMPFKVEEAKEAKGKAG
jgi:large subunit ribosomal protein L5